VYRVFASVGFHNRNATNNGKKASVPLKSSWEDVLCLPSRSLGEGWWRPMN
jgi:hypothetical protein